MEENEISQANKKNVEPNNLSSRSIPVEVEDILSSIVGVATKQEQVPCQQGSREMSKCLARTHSLGITAHCHSWAFGDAR